MNYAEAIEYLEAHEKFGINLGLERIKFILKECGNPEKSLKTIHIGGTNGKGSVVAMISSILISAGYHIGTYTSPHLLDYTERIKISGLDVDKEYFAKLLTKIKGILESCERELSPPTIFEILTSIAFLSFAEKKVNLAVLEVGLGGRLDATNVINPLVSIITNVDYDHTEVLGTTIEEIAYEKAGIIKEGIPVVTASQAPALDVIKEISLARSAPLTIVSQDIKIIKNEGGYAVPDGLACRQTGRQVDIKGRKGEYLTLPLPLFGNHQIINLATVIAALEILMDCRFKVSLPDMRSGLKKTIWRGRFEIIRRKPLIILDGAHNPASAKVLAESLNSFPIIRPLTFILGILEYKEIKKIIENLAPCADLIIATKSKHKKAADPKLLVQEIQKHNIPTVMTDDVEGALDLAIVQGFGGTICVTGSLYTVAEAILYLEKHLTEGRSLV